MAINTPKPTDREKYPVASGSVTKILVRRDRRETRLTFLGREDGNLTIKVKPFLIGDDNKPASSFPTEQFESATGAVIDFSTDRRSVTFTGELIAIMIDDTGYSGSDPLFEVQVHQRN